MVRRAEVVAGFAGSAMFHVALAGRADARGRGRLRVLPGPQRVPDVRRCSATGSTWSCASREVPRVDGQFTRASFHSDFTYRPEREGVFLRSVLASSTEPQH